MVVEVRVTTRVAYVTNEVEATGWKRITSSNKEREVHPKHNRWGGGWNGRVKEISEHLRETFMLCQGLKDQTK